MNEKYLVRQFSKLHSIAPRPEWVKKNKEVLSYQIFNGQESSAPALSFWSRFGLVAHHLLQPSSVAALIVLFFVVSGVVSVNASKETTPNDVLYIAKIISEKAEFAVAFDEKTKAELNVRYAKNRAAELNKIIEGAGVTESDPRVQELSDSFKKEIAAVKDRLHKFDEEAAKQATIEAQTQPKAKLNLSGKGDTGKTDVTTDEKKSNGDEVFSAEAGKDEKGIDISIPVAKTLEEAEKLFNDKNYNEAVSKLDEIKIK